MGEESRAGDRKTLAPIRKKMRMSQPSNEEKCASISSSNLKETVLEPLQGFMLFQAAELLVWKDRKFGRFTLPGMRVML